MKKLLILLLLSLTTLLYSQVENIVIQWDTTDIRHFFSNALYADGDNTLPYVTRKIPWTSKGMIPKVTIQVTESTVIDEERLSGTGVYTGHAGPAPLLEYSLVRAAGKSYVVVKTLPFRRTASGKLERINTFQIKLEGEPALAALKSEIKGSWAAHSVLASGNWYKISVEQTGMHKLTYEQLQEAGLQNPASVRIYGSGAKQLPEAFSQGYIDDLASVPVHMFKGSDGIFGPGDFILFYAQGPVAWSYDMETGFFRHHLHAHARKGYYFLTDSQGPVDTPELLELSEQAPTMEVSSYDYRSYREDETYNLIKSGKTWFGDKFSVNLEEHYPFTLQERVAGEPVQIRVAVAARSGVSSTFSVRANNNLLGSVSVSNTDLSHYTATYAYQNNQIFSYLPQDDYLTVSLTYNRPDPNSEGWLDAITVNGRSHLRLNGNELAFRDSRSTGAGNITRFSISNVNSETVIWEVTQPGFPVAIPYNINGSVAEFTIETGQLREFIAFDPTGNFPVPVYTGEGVGPVENQDLHGFEHPDMVIVTPAPFLEQAERLATFRESEDGLVVAVVLQEQVFNEFSSGTPDVSALRNFMKMFYDRSGGTGPYCRYLLLMGDGSYDNRGSKEKPNNPNLLLTYQSDESLSPTRSYVSDDFFGLLDTDETMYNGLLDIGIGRLPVSDEEEARLMVDKIIGYQAPDKQGDWRNQLCFIGDDEDSNIHMRQADELARYVNVHYPDYNINKIYLDAYPQEERATGDRYPDVNRAINNQMNRGALIVNYTGHGGDKGLGHEQIVTFNDIFSWKNKNKLTLFMTATCEFSRYDEYDRSQDQETTSAGEEVLLNPEGGSIALFTTTRLVYSGPNYVLNEKFYEVVFSKDANQQNYRLGDIIIYSKNNAGAGINKRNFTLLGDPSMLLTYPQQRVVTDSIDGRELSAGDTISAFQWVTISGHLETREGMLMENFNGTVYPLVFDKEKRVETLSNDGGPVYKFSTRNNILYSGKTSAKAGRFSFGFYVPKDINYSFGSGKISYYSNDSLVDAHGSCENFTVGGIGSDNAFDSEPPEVELYMNDTFFVSGGITNNNPELLVRVRDNFGINTTGNGIGHDLTAVMDEDRINAIILNEFYQANINSYNSGVIRYPYSNLEPGRHRVTVKIWDIHNNSSVANIDFLVVETEAMLLEQLYNYPNPFFDRTWFNIAHNRPDSNLKLVLTIYNLSGEMVRIIERRIFSAGYRLEPVEWDGTSEGGSKMGGGVYLYRATITTEEGEVASESGKLIITR